MGERDEISGLLKSDPTRECIAEYLKNKQQENFCAMFMVAIDDYEKLKKKIGIEEGKDVLYHVGEVLPALFRATDIIGQTAEDTFVIFISGDITKEAVYKKSHTLCENLQFAVKGRDTSFINVTVCTGVYIAPIKNLTCEILYNGAKQALKQARKFGTGSFYIEAASLDRREEQNENTVGPVNAIHLHTLLKYMEGSVCLLEVGEEISLIYASPGFYQMTGYDPDAFALPCPLDRIGIHPDYILDYKKAIREGTKKTDVTRHIHRIRGKNSQWIWRQVRVVHLSHSDSTLSFMLELSTDISELMEKERQLKESNERLKIAFGQTPHVMWEVDVKKRTYGIYDINSESCEGGTIMTDFPDSLLENGMVHADSAANFRGFAENLLKGSDADSGNFIIRDIKNNSYEWVALSYHMTFDEDGNPEKAIGIQEKLPEITGLNSTFMTRRPLPEALRHRLLARIQINLTTDSVEYLWMEGKDRTAWTWGKSYSDILENEEIRLFLQGEGREFKERFKRKNLLKAYERGERWSTNECRRISDDGSIRWMTDMVNLQYNPKTESVYMFACFIDCQQRKDWEKKLPEEDSRDKEHGLYLQKTVMELCDSLLVSGSGLCAMACIEIRGTEYLDACDKSGRTRDFIFLVLSYALGTECVAGQYEKNMLIAFFPKVSSKFDVKRKIEDAMAYVRNAMTDVSQLDKVRFIAGVIMAQNQETNAEIMRIQATYICRLWENSAMDFVAFPSEDEDWSWINMRVDVPSLTAEEEKPETPLTKDAQDAVLNCVTSMLTADSLEDSIENALRYIGRYYKAKRVYILALSEDRQEVNMLHEWMGRGKYSIRQIMSGMHISKIPLLMRCMKEGQPLFMKSTEGGFKKKDEQNTCWRFIVYPLKQYDKVKGFVCVEDAKEHYTDASLLMTVIPYIANEYKRFHLHTEKQENDQMDTLSRIPNLRTYTDVIHSMNSDVYSSMGTVALDIPNYSALNGKFGFEYGRELLFYIIEILNKLFGKGFIFRTWDAEFVVLFPNTILEVFVGRCTRLRAMLQRRYPHQIRIGYTWSDGIFSANNLVKEAKAIMRCEEVRDAMPDRTGILKGSWLNNADSSILNKNFVMYLQPKVDMRDGSLIGAEALVRGIDEKGELISPSQFIESMEKDGGIRELDFFMLESVLRQLSRWKSEGLDPVNVSVNISRYTLFNPTVLASILAIYSHYPEIPMEQVKLEITETAGDVEKTTLAGIVEEFRKFGIGFELDDFGSRYANVSIFSNIKFNTIKLDRSLINDLAENEISRILVENIASICNNFGMVCVAEGVETEKQKEVLLNAGCIYGQGYYYSRPMPVWKFEEKYLKKPQK